MSQRLVLLCFSPAGCTDTLKAQLTTLCLSELAPVLPNLQKAAEDSKALAVTAHEVATKGAFLQACAAVNGHEEKLLTEELSTGLADNWRALEASLREKLLETNAQETGQAAEVEAVLGAAGSVLGHLMEVLAHPAR